MTLLRKYLPSLCGLLAALWLLFAAAGLAGACFGPLAAASAVAGVESLESTGLGHDTVLSKASHRSDAGARLVCAKQCADEFGGVLKPAAPDLGVLAILVGVVSCLLRLPLPLVLSCARCHVSRYAVIVGTPPPTIRFHRFNN